MSRVQGTVISAGTELEKLIWERSNKIEDLDRFLADTLNKGEDKIYVASKWQVKKCKTINSQYEPDFLAFNPAKRECYIIEVKDGDTFDTKKASGEHAMLKNFTNDIAQNIAFSTKVYLCSFNSNTIDEIYDGLKHKFAKEELMTGKALCVLFKIDYDEIIKVRTSDQQINLDYFVNAILAIGNIKNMIVKRLYGQKPD